MKFALILAIALSVIMAFFAVQNSQHAQVSFLGWSFDGAADHRFVAQFCCRSHCCLFGFSAGIVQKIHGNLKIEIKSVGLLAKSRIP